MGWDDNGLPTERRVQNYYGVRCDPSLPYDPDFTAPARAERPRTAEGDPTPISRRNFIELCDRLTAEDEKAFEDLWRHLGLSVDWALHLHHHRRALAAASPSAAFLRNLARGEAYPAEAPTLWDVDFQTAVAQAELEDRERAGRLPPPRASTGRRRGDVLIETTRPELLPACVALVAHPDDERYQPLFGPTVRTPAVRRRGAGPRPRAGRARQGHRHRHDLHVRRPHRRHLVARAAAADPRRSSAATAGSLRRPPAVAIDASDGAEPLRASWPARPSSRRQTRIVELLARVRRADRRADADHPPGEVLREGRPPARDRHDPAVVHPQRRPRRRPARRPARAGPASCTGTRRTCRSATTTGSTASTATG